MGTLVALVLLLSCGPPRDDSDCRMRCHACEPSCINIRGSLEPAHDEECPSGCDVDNEVLFCVVEADECVLASG